MKITKFIGGNMRECVIIGGGPAGLTASIYLSRYKIDNLIIAKDFGMASETPEIENYPGFIKIGGTELVKKMTEHAKHFGAEIVYDEVKKIEKIEGGFKIYSAMSSEPYETKTVILAMGTHKRKLNVPGEDKFLGKGVSYCATCDAAFFQNDTVGVVGGGNSAMTTALLLRKFGNTVHMFVRDGLSGERILIDKIKQDDKIVIHDNVEVEEIVGDQMMSGVIIKNRFDNSINKVDVNGLFIEIGLIPNTELVKGMVELDERGLIKVDNSMMTSIPGMFAAGDITNGSNRLMQVITAAAEGAIAANSVYNYLTQK